MTLPPTSEFAHEEDLYNVLNISPLALPAEIPPAYRRAALVAHPDKGGSAEAFQLVTRAFEVLACASSRQSYDQSRNRGSFLVAKDLVTESELDVRGSAKRPAATPGAPQKKQRSDQGSKASAPPGPSQPHHVNANHPQVLPESTLSKALCNLKKVLHAMCIEHRREAISTMVLRVRRTLLTFMETEKRMQAAMVDVEKRVEGHATQGMLPLENVIDNSCCMDVSCAGDTNKENTTVECTSTSESKPVALKAQNFTLSQVSCTESESESESTAAHAEVACGRHFDLPSHADISQWKQEVATSAMPKIQRDPRYKNSKYKAQLHIKSLRIYSKSRTIIDSAIDYQIILMQIRLAWMTAWRASADMWEQHPQRFASLLEGVIAANGTSGSEMGIKAFVSMQVRPWLGSKCFIISPVMELTEALELQACLLRARRMSWLDFRAEWVELMQRKRCAHSKVHSAEEAERIADAAYEQHQIFLNKRMEELKKRSEARSLAQKLRQEKEEHERSIRWYERERQKKERQVERQKLLQARSERCRVKKYAFLEKQLAKAVRAVERALDKQARAKARSDAREKVRKSSKVKRPSKGKQTSFHTPASTFFKYSNSCRNL